MAKLVLHGKKGTQREVTLDKQRVSIGRLEDNDICLQDKATSGHHAAVITIGKNSYLQDLKSTNGTLVNGMPVNKHTLKHGDVILIGRSHMSYVDEPETQRPDPEATMKVDHAQPSPLEAEKAAKPAAARVEPEKQETTVDDREEGAEYAPWAERVDKDAPPKDMVDNMLEAIRSHREHERTQEVRRKETVAQEWKKLIEATTTLKKRIAGNPRVKFFDIARDQSEILIRIQREGSRTGQHSILIARQHPHQPSPLETIWLIETGSPDKHKESCEEIMRDVMKTLAPLIA